MSSPSSSVSANRRRRDEAAQRPIASALPLDGAHVLSINESHERCAALGLSRIGSPDYSPIPRSDFTVTRERNRRLFAHAAPVMELLFDQIVRTQSLVVLTDSQGTILHTIGDDDMAERAGKVALAPGVNWAECAKGTNAIGTALIDETAMLVHADEHFMHANHFLSCQASPILDPRGNILGVLDVTGDRRGYHQHTMGLVKMSARMIENHWLNDDFSDALRLHFHPRVEFIGTLMEGILAVDRDGRILGGNRSALDLLGLSGAALRTHTVATLLGAPMGAIVDGSRGQLNLPVRMVLPNGLAVHAQARCNWPLWQRGTPADGSSVAATAAAAAVALQADAALLGQPLPRTDGPAPEPTPVKAAEVASEPPSSPAAAGPVASFARLQTGDAQVEAVIGKLRRVLDRSIPVLVLGEAGSGKEQLARALHAESRRRDQPFVSVQCASTGEELLAAELFGYVEGVFGGARRKAHVGKLVQANGGTLFLDEIGGLPAGLQARLLRALVEREITPIGAVTPIPLDIALVSATDRSPRDLLHDHTIREDLYYRLNGLTVKLPALRERSDLGALIARSLADHSQEGTKLRLAGDVEQLLRDHDWPGNLRELDGVLRTAAVMAAGEPAITREHLSDDFLEDAAARAQARVSSRSATPPSVQPARTPVSAPLIDRATSDGSEQTLEQLERETIRRAVDAAGGNISVASKRLGISRNTIYRKLRADAPAA